MSWRASCSRDRDDRHRGGHYAGSRAEAHTKSSGRAPLDSRSPPGNRRCQGRQPARDRDRDSRDPPIDRAPLDSRSRPGERRWQGRQPARDRDRDSRYSPHRSPSLRRRQVSRSPSWRRQRVSTRSRSRSQGRSSGRGVKDAGAGEKESTYRIPPPANRRKDPIKADEVELSQEMQLNSFEHEGFRYATMDFAAPQTPCGVSPVLPKPYENGRVTPDDWLPWHRMPNGWKLVPTEVEDSVKEKVIGAFDWGTHLLVVEGGRAYVTQGGKQRGKPGTLQMIWELDRGPNGLKLQKLRGAQAYWCGKLFIRAPVQ